MREPAGRRRRAAQIEAAIGLGSYAAYMAVRRAVWNDHGRRAAAANAERIVALEQRTGLHVEPAVQGWATRYPRALDALNAGYAGANVALTIGWLHRLFRRDDPSYRRHRRAAVLSFAGALPVFLLFPTAPPRSRPEFVDTMADRGLDLEHPLIVRFYNPVAAMPSQHMAFAVVTGLGAAAGARSRTARRLWRTYPAVVAGIVIATANHFVLDVLAGTGLGLIARRLAR